MRLRPPPLVLAILVTATACGRKLPPVAPLQVLPARVEPLRVSQEESDAVLRFPFPSRTTTGGPLAGLAKVTVYREILPAPSAAPPPKPPAGNLREREERLFLMRAEKVRDLSPAELYQAALGDDLVVRDSLSALFSAKRLGKVFLRYGVMVSSGAKKTSELSPLVAIRPLIPPAEPRDLQATVAEGSVCLEWRRPEAMLDGSRPVTVGAYAVYRREVAGGAEAVYEDPIALEKQEWFDDKSAQPDRKFVYTVRAAPSTEKPVVLGPPADEVFTDTRDVFPPARPEGFQVLAELDGNRLVWNPALAPDLDHYLVYKRARVTDRWPALPLRLNGTTWFDAGAGAETEYAVSAVDHAGNESAKAEGSTLRGGER